MSLPRHISGELVYKAISDHPGIPSRLALAARTGLSPNQVSAGLLWVKEIAAYENKTPFTWSHRNGYRVEADFDLCHLYEKAQAFSEYNRMKRLLLGTFGPHAALDPTDLWVHKMTRRLEASCDDLGSLLQLEPVPWPLP